MKREHEFRVFLRYFASNTYLVRHVIAMLVVHIVIGAVLISYLEDLPIGDATYFAFVTGMTIGYGDIAPLTTGGRIVSVAIGFVGVLFTGTTVAVATRSLTDTVSHKAEQPS